MKMQHTAIGTCVFKEQCRSTRSGGIPVEKASNLCKRRTVSRPWRLERVQFIENGTIKDHGQWGAQKMNLVRIVACGCDNSYWLSDKGVKHP
uniref:Uncharacterized protein n=1 Tax=Oryza glumipatula TaxID=40148 RepID=A0A0E0B6L0_9ORYZ